MILAGYADVEMQLWQWVFAMVRPGAALIAAPVFGATAVPLQVRIILALMIGMAATNLTPITLPIEDAATLQGLLFLTGEVVAGAAIGFALQLGYSTAFIAGELIGNTMGLGFARMNDPVSGTPSAAVGNFLSIVAVLMLLAIDGHLLLIGFIVKSYAALPPGAAWLSFDIFRQIVDFGSTLFAIGLVVALPVGTAIILVQLLMGMLARSAPSLNLFAVGLPVTLISGLVLLAVTAPIMASSLINAIEQSLFLSELIASGG